MAETHQLELEDVTEIATRFQDDPQMRGEIATLPYILKLSPKAKTKLAANKSPDIFMKSVELLEIFIGEKDADATYEELLRALRGRTMYSLSAQVVEILNRKITARNIVHVNIEHGNQITV